MSACSGGGSAKDAAGAAIPTYTYRVVHTYPHDPKAFTEGLVYDSGTLYESTGLAGSSTLRAETLETGAIKQEVSLASLYFGEGTTVFGGKLYQLTWQTQIGFVYNQANLQQTDHFSYDWEGWGMTHDDASLILSDGTSTLRFLDPATFKVKKTLTVTASGTPVSMVNELEYVKGQIYANIWHTNRIARIDPATGKVVGWIDLTGLLSAQDQPTDPEGVLNGIAYDAVQDRLFVTGKLWPKLFEIQVVPK